MTEDLETVKISRGTFSRLQEMGVPLVDTPESIIVELLEYYENNQASARCQAATETEETHKLEAESGDLVFSSSNLPDLLHTKIKRAVVDGERVDCGMWQMMLVFLLEKAYEICGNGEDVISICNVLQIVEGKSHKNGWHYIHGLDLSFRTVCANRACRQIDDLARTIRAQVTLHIVWRDKDRAAYRGKTARLELGDGAGNETQGP